ncbi:lipoate--protein ligase [Prolixibacter sp. SD074]|jgi:lipoate-protein ligase A|uniref:lipoate--protein ligase n=1 Tax=Prolixibacter sp. SD074 TaxID=2652391 RepID=UPI0012767523|nr:lipoate--protein ligase [Prolixibacter sp. SD074]GET30452.1 lipoate--protein ligase [Prolixibacter sp. SD074]
MYYLVSSSNNPYFNIASEEYLLKNFTDEFFLLYINEPSIIVGKHQNTLSEINLDYVEANGIKVVRRLSGGGTVFHDSGNLNFCFIRNIATNEDISFTRFTQPIVNALATLGIEATFSGRHDLLVKGRKISGNAMHVYKKRVLSHGTLLYNSQIGTISRALKSNPSYFQDKAVKSNRSRVANISSFLSSPPSIEAFTQQILAHIREVNPHAKPYTFSSEDLAAIGQLQKEKFGTWKWNYGYSPKYVFQKDGLVSGGPASLSLKIEKGRIKTVELRCEILSVELVKVLSGKLMDTFHERNDIRGKLQQFFEENNLKKIKLGELLNLFF